MSNFRFMRVIIFFDLPVETLSQRREYSRFRRLLIKSGFIMMQESVYSKLTLNKTVADSVMQNIRKNKPSGGIVQMLVITEKQYTNIEFIVGEKSSNIIDNTERLLIL